MLNDSPIIIVGAGPVGLTTSLLLSQWNIPHLVIEQRKDTVRMPQAHVVRTRTMEIFRQLGLEDQVMQNRTDMAIENISWKTALR